MPGDLIGYVSGPTPYSSLWLWLAVALSLILLGWYPAVLLFTMPRRPLRSVPLAKAARDRLVRRRFARAVHGIGDSYRAGEIGPALAGEAVSRELRRFLHLVTGVRADYMQLDDIAHSELSPATPLLAELTDVQFNAESELDVDRVSRDAEELIRSWV